MPGCGFGADQRKQVERLCRYITRPAIANERLSRNAKGQVVLRLKSPYRDGTTHIVMQPQEFMQRLAALVPRPRLHLIRFHGVLAPHAKLRAAIIPQPTHENSAPVHEHAHGQSARMSCRESEIFTECRALTAPSTGDTVAGSGKGVLKSLFASDSIRSTARSRNCTIGYATSLRAGPRSSRRPASPPRET
jgi:hypothetical protein